ncbi:aminoglycoside phosphotransferase family protein [Enterococcus rivorum]|uniref:Protein kinase domain-containing protein n=1 Tax=Enterococcus rivorum TaxID=762845 RepID=A0A1E5KUB8_9ENTE|nr:aminoglycoside phosphotransferase family protein [Enterococcus rivorum]MBP2098943.1 aminoglycoside phosphotransferase (APT) family kinase protein [Enterococcus rivorum]OEH81460.1 hypothetical protein BCR26_04225 [Enterococcus rivorum]
MKKNELLSKLKNLKLLNKKDNTEVYEATLNEVPVIIKYYSTEQNFQRELNALQALEKKRVKTPQILSFYNGFWNKEVGYIIQEKLQGDTLLEIYSDIKDKEGLLYECGEALGKINKILTLNELDISNIWKYSDFETDENFKQYDWKKHFMHQIPVWIEKVDKKYKSEINYVKLEEILLQGLKEVDSSIESIGLMHRDYGFRNILYKNINITGIIDFEHAMIGDIFFDTTKLIFNNLDFVKDCSLQKSFFDGWSKETRVYVDDKKMWLYLAIQGLGAIQWVDGQKLIANRYRHLDYRKKGEGIVSEALHYMS